MIGNTGIIQFLELRATHEVYLSTSTCGRVENLLRGLVAILYLSISTCGRVENLHR